MNLDIAPDQRHLLERILAFRFDDSGTVLPFHIRLARENGWTIGFSARAITEYRRFVFLAMVAGQPVTPSDQVDQVWHLHLLYTRSYWERFCGDVLGRPFHHEPTRGGSHEADKFTQWYDQTLDSYRRTFREDPPQDIWPEAAIRFGEDVHGRRVNTRRAWVLPKPWRMFR